MRVSLPLQPFQPFCDFALDFGTATTQLSAPGHGLLAQEPTLVAVRSEYGNERIAAVGHRAKVLSGKTASSLATHRPVENGSIRDFELARSLLRQLFSALPRRLRLLARRLLVGVSPQASDQDVRTLIAATQFASEAKIFIADEPVLAILGTGLPLADLRAALVVDIGAGTSDASVVCPRGVIISRSTHAAGDAFDQAIARMVYSDHQLRIGTASAERIKLELGRATNKSPQHSMLVQGQDLRSLFPGQVRVNEEMVVRALREPIDEIARMINQLLEETAPEFAGDLLDTGIILVGAGSQLPEIDTLIAERTGLPVRLVEQPASCSLRGAEKILRNWKKYQHLLSSP
jgi:rod shape-determining protein MreB